MDKNAMALAYASGVKLGELAVNGAKSYAIGIDESAKGGAPDATDVLRRAKERGPLTDDQHEFYMIAAAVVMDRLMYQAMLRLKATHDEVGHDCFEGCAALILAELSMAAFDSALARVQRDSERAEKANAGAEARRAAFAEAMASLDNVDGDTTGAAEGAMAALERLLASMNDKGAEE